MKADEELRSIVNILQSNTILFDDKVFTEFCKAYHVAIDGLVLIADIIAKLDEMTRGQQAEFSSEDLLAVKSFIESRYEDLLAPNRAKQDISAEHPVKANHWGEMVTEIESGPNYLYPPQEPFNKHVSINYVLAILNKYRKYFTERGQT